VADATKYQPPDMATMERRLKAADKPGDHLWVITAAWMVADPRAAREGVMLLDIENIVALAGIGCFKCEREFSNRLARQPCRGSVDDVQAVHGG
jgi:hypothetical protein